jgi:hypothetical protein
MSWFSDKGKRSWVASLIFLVMVIGLIFFFTYMHIPDKNKDVIVGIVGMIIGSISSMISIFSGRDPDDIKELKEEIIKLNDDRSTLISRLRDAQLDKEHLRKQLQALQTEVISRLSIFVGIENLMKIGRIDEKSKKEIEKWIPNKIKIEELVSDAPKNMRTFNSVNDKDSDPPITREPKPSSNIKEGQLDDDFWKDFNKK